MPKDSLESKPNTANLSTGMDGVAKYLIADLDELAGLPDEDKEESTQHLVILFETTRDMLRDAEDEAMVCASTEFIFPDEGVLGVLAIGQRLGEFGVYDIRWVRNPEPETMEDIFTAEVMQRKLGWLQPEADPEN